MARLSDYYDPIYNLIAQQQTRKLYFSCRQTPCRPEVEGGNIACVNKGLNI